MEVLHTIDRELCLGLENDTPTDGINREGNSLASHPVADTKEKSKGEKRREDHSKGYRRYGHGKESLAFANILNRVPTR